MNTDILIKRLIELSANSWKSRNKKYNSNYSTQLGSFKFVLEKELFGIEDGQRLYSYSLRIYDKNKEISLDRLNNIDQLGIDLYLEINNKVNLYLGTKKGHKKNNKRLYKKRTETERAREKDEEENKKSLEKLEKLLLE